MVRNMGGSKISRSHSCPYLIQKRFCCHKKNNVTHRKGKLNNCTYNNCNKCPYLTMSPTKLKDGLGELSKLPDAIVEVV